MNVTAKGASGSAYPFVAYPHATTTWNSVPGIYAFAYWVSGPTAYWHVLYFGQCDSFSNRIPTHERWTEAQKLGATHILVHVNQNGETSRLAAERDLIASHSPQLNTQHVGLGAGSLFAAVQAANRKK